MAEEDGVVQVPLEGYKYVVLQHLGKKYISKSFYRAVNICLASSLFTEGYPSSISQMKCPKGLLETHGMPTINNDHYN